MATLKIRTTKDAQQQDRIDPELLRILLERKEHERICEDCERAQTTQDARHYCATGRGLMEQIVAHPDVEVQP